jgi:hypothetical protein
MVWAEIEAVSILVMYLSLNTGVVTAFFSLSKEYKRISPTSFSRVSSNLLSLCRPLKAVLILSYV